MTVLRHITTSATALFITCPLWAQVNGEAMYSAVPLCHRADSSVYLVGSTLEPRHHNSLVFVDYSDVHKRESSINAAALGIQVEGGKWRNADDALRQWTMGAEAQLYKQIGSMGRTSTVGNVRYLRCEGADMNGSVMVGGTDKPFDIVAVDSTPGTKVFEQYHVGTMAQHKLGQGWTIVGGAQIDASNYAKHKDLRHKNKVLDLGAEFGIAQAVNNNTSLALSYMYRHRVEGIGYGIYGNKDQHYQVLVDYGTYWGEVQEASTSIGFAQTSNELPLSDNWHTIKAIGQYSGTKLSAMAEAYIGQRCGYYGLETTYTPKLTQHQGTNLGGYATVLFEQGNTQQRLDIGAEIRQLSNYAKLYRVETDNKKQQSIRYYGRQLTQKAQWHEAEVQYTLCLKPLATTLQYRQGMPTTGTWTLQAAWNTEGSQRTVSRSGIERKQTLAHHNFRFALQRDFGTWVYWLLRAQTTFGTGSGGNIEQRSTGSEIMNTKMVELSDALRTDIDYRTRNTATHKVEVEIWPRAIKKPWVGCRASVTHTTAFSSGNLATHYRWGTCATLFITFE